MEETTYIHDVLTADLFSDLISSLSEHIGVLLPLGIGIFSSIVCISLVPRIVYKFI